MDIQTLLAGYRPLRGDEREAKLSALERAFENYKKIGKSEKFEDFLNSLPEELVVNYFGSAALDSYLSTILAILHKTSPIKDVYYTAISHVLVMMLTFQGRSLRKALPTEVSVHFGSSNDELVQTMTNGNLVTGISVNNNAEELTTDLTDKYVKALSGLAGTAVQNLSYTPGEAERWINAQTSKVGLIALNDLEYLDAFNSFNVSTKPFLHDGSYFMFSADPIHVFGTVKQIKAACPEVEIDTRTYNIKRGALCETKTVLVCRGNLGNLKLELEDISTIPVKFVSVYDKFFGGDSRFSVIPYGEDFVDEGIAENVVVKPPMILKSSAPLPVYTRNILENTHPVAHVTATIKGGGVYYSRDHKHSTYIFITDKGEVIDDFMEDGSFHASPVYENSVLDDEKRTGTIERRESFHIGGNVIPLCFAPTVHTFHSHFLLQCFPKVLIAREKFPDAKFFVPHDLRGYQKDMLALVGVGSDRLIPMEPNKTYFAENLVAPRLWPAIFTKFSEQIYSELMDRSGKAVTNPKRNILISREARTTWRNMVNYDVIKDILVDEFGFEVVQPEKLSIIDEIELFKNAKIIAGAEGAGLYNCCFASPKAKVLSIADQDYAMYIIGSMAAIRGFDVAYVIGESFLPEADIPLRGAGHSDFIVDPSKLRAAVKELIKN